MQKNAKMQLSLTWELFAGEMIRVLFPRNVKALQGHQTSVKGGLTTLSSGQFPLSGDVGESSTMPSSNFTSSIDQTLKMNWGLFGETIDALKLEARRKEGSFMTSTSNVAKIKVEIDLNLKFLTASIAQFFYKNPFDGEYGSIFAEADKMLDELKQLSSAFDTRDKKNEINFQSIGDLLKSLQLRRPKLETFLNQPLMDNSVVCLKASESSILHQKSQNEEVHHKKAEDVSKSDKGKVNVSPEAVASKTQTVSRNQETGGNKGKGNSKSKKNKRGKGGRKNK